MEYTTEKAASMLIQGHQSRKLKKQASAFFRNRALDGLLVSKKRSKTDDRLPWLYSEDQVFIAAALRPAFCAGMGPLSGPAIVSTLNKKLQSGMTLAQKVIKDCHERGAIAQITVDIYYSPEPRASIAGAYVTLSTPPDHRPVGVNDYQVPEDAVWESSWTTNLTEIANRVVAGRCRK